MRERTSVCPKGQVERAIIITAETFEYPLYARYPVYTLEMVHNLVLTIALLGSDYYQHLLLT